MEQDRGLPFRSAAVPRFLAAGPGRSCASFGDNMKLPDEYARYCADDGPKEGGLSVQPLWFQLWPPDQVEQLNRDYQVAEFAPGFVGFGSNGGGELLAFDASGRVFMVPFVGMCPEDARPVAQSWSEFVEKMER